MSTMCAEQIAPPCGMVVFGASGDLVHRKLIASLYSLYRNKLLTDNFYMIGCGRKEFSDEQFREKSLMAISADFSDDKEDIKRAFLEMIFYQQGDYDDPDLYKKLVATIDKCGKERHACGCCVFYLATPPSVFNSIVDGLGQSGLSYTGVTNANQCSRIIIEKPFGRDLGSSILLDEVVHKYFDESQIYRIDHYLGKETVQNILMFRFANSIFEPIWNRNYIDHVQITIAESLGVEHRAGYYDKSGAIRDMFQNHMIQLLALVGMEPPACFEADSLRNEKVKVIRSLRPIDLKNIEDYFVLGQYAPGRIDDQEAVGYLEEDGVDKYSRTETFAACKLFIDNWRWKGVPFYLRSGKRLKQRVSEIAITFKDVPHSMFHLYGLSTLPANVLVLRIQPEEEISLSFQAKRPGSKVCMSTIKMDFRYSDVFGGQQPQAYQRLLLDAMIGDQTLFAREDAVRYSWEFFTPVLEWYEKTLQKPYLYAAGEESFLEAQMLIEQDNRKWRKI